MLKWPDRHAVEAALQRWSAQVLRARTDVVRVGYFGSYARGDWGVGSDVDLVVVVERSDKPFESRAVGWGTLDLPVPADLIVYTQAEWESLDPDGRFRRMLDREAKWLYCR